MPQENRPDYHEIAEQIRAAGVPDCLNRYLTMTPSELDHAIESVKPKRRIEVAKGTGEKAAQLRALRETNAAAAAASPSRSRKRVVEKESGAKAATEVVVQPIPEAPIEQPKATAKAEPKESSVMRKSSLKPKTSAKAKPATTTARRTPSVSNARRSVAESVPSGKAAEVGKLASRVNGASREELVELTGWAVQPWKFYFENSKGKGFCQRFGYKLDVLVGKHGETRYKITKK